VVRFRVFGQITRSDRCITRQYFRELLTGNEEVNDVTSALEMNDMSGSAP